MYNSIIESVFNTQPSPLLVASLGRIVEIFSRAKYGKFLNEDSILSLMKSYPDFAPRRILPFMTNPYDLVMGITIDGSMEGHISDFHLNGDENRFVPIYQDCEDYIAVAKACEFDQTRLDDAHTFPLTLDNPDSTADEFRITQIRANIKRELTQKLHPIYIQYLKIGLIWLSPRHETKDAVTLLYDDDPEVVKCALNLTTRRANLSALKRIVKILKDSKHSSVIQDTSLDYYCLLVLQDSFYSRGIRKRDYYLNKILEKYKKYLRTDNWQIESLYQWRSTDES